MAKKDEVGAKGEKVAQEYLVKNGFYILHTNWRYGHKELDIVALKKNVLHIVEVKTRTSDYWEDPKDAVVRRKQKNMIDAADAYIRQENINEEAQFDVIAIVINNSGLNIEYIPNAFSPSEIL